MVRTEQVVTTWKRLWEREKKESGNDTWTLVWLAMMLELASIWMCIILPIYYCINRGNYTPRAWEKVKLTAEDMRTWPLEISSFNLKLSYLRLAPLPLSWLLANDRSLTSDGLVGRPPRGRGTSQSHSLDTKNFFNDCRHFYCFYYRQPLVLCFCKTTYTMYPLHKVAGTQNCTFI